MQPRLTILDDYQNIALTLADWSTVAAAYDVDVVTEPITEADALIGRLRDSEVIVAMRERTAFPAATLAQLPNLKLLVTTGMVNAAIDLNAARAQGITVCGTSGKSNSMPEITFGMMIALARNFVQEDRAVRAGGWQHTIGPGLAGYTLGLVGLGRLGSAMVPPALAFGMNVSAWSPNLTPERAAAVDHRIRAVSRAELFAEADYVSIHLVLGRRSRGLIGAEDLARMRPTAYLINTSRGPIVQESALIDALRDGRIAGAALDVYDAEPLPVGHPLRSLPNTLLLPHIGYVTYENYKVFYEHAVEDVLAFAGGAPVRVL